MADVEQEIVEAGAQIVWVLEEDVSRDDGTAESCRLTLDHFGSTEGWCVGDGQTEPSPGTFDDSPFSVGRGFDLIVPRETMRIAYTTNHGTPEGNENPSGEEVLEQVRRIADELR